MAISLLNKTEYKISDTLTVFIPTLGQYRSEQREQYDVLMNLFMATPSNYMLQLHRAGIDFTKLGEYQFFLQLFATDYLWNESQTDSKILFKDIDFKDLVVQETNGHIILCDKQGRTIIDEYTYLQVGALFCEVLNTKKFRKKPANKTAYDYFIELAEDKERNSKRLRRKSETEFDDLIIAMVCQQGFMYDFNTINTLTLYDFWCCVQQIIKNNNYTNLMRGIYSGFGTVNPNKISQSELNYLSFRK